jgi:drug/metabolite transporter (DMT)-like permease
MKIGAGELLLVVLVIVILVAFSRAKKVTQDVKKQAAAPARQAAKPSLKYPQLQLLGVLAMLTGAAMAVIGYLIAQGVIDTLSIAGIAVLALGIGFIILARRR